MRKSFLFCAAVLTISLELSAQWQNQPEPLKVAVDETTFREHVRVLASDEYGGRKPLTPYEQKTIDYIAGEFKKLGLQPAGGDSYFQEVPLVDATVKAKGGKFVVKGPKGSTTLRDFDDDIIWTARKDLRIGLKNAEFVFVGFGINAPEFGWNDYEGIDVKGKVVVALVNDPGYYDQTLFKGRQMTYYGRWIYKFEEASRQGAAGILVVHDDRPASYGWNVVQASWWEHNLELINDKDNRDLVLFKGWVTRPKATELFENAGYTYEELLTRAQKKGFRSFSLQSKANIDFVNDVSVGISHNVAAVLPGTDLKDEYVIYNAHWDHFGIGKPIDGDSIYNGASDNASGVATILTIAKKFAELGVKPRRSILFLGVTAEEAVLLGSQHYVTHPLVPLEKTVAVLNYDGTAPAPATYDVIHHAENTADKFVRIAAEGQGRTYVPVKSGTGYRSDHFSFNRVGVPTIVTRGGRSQVKEGARGRKPGTYHQPSDEYSEDWDVAGTVQNIGLTFSIGWLIANTDETVEWYPDAPYRRK
ncbi:MAG: M20/M25/M40 family metallo-hydrolase [Bacteroidaceae bacterium]|nr:M20/M25/M40 family metallo-hydrolase [Bacteroidaceae bacterium]MBR1669041.1 M20/M25/M40 family metallo-hydrolase [Bacteroidaceae bacterium]